jgi:hypothetical protein
MAPPTLGASLFSPPSEIQMLRRRRRGLVPPRQGADDRNGAPTSGRASEEGAEKRLERILGITVLRIILREDRRPALTFLCIFGSP